MNEKSEKGSEFLLENKVYTIGEALIDFIPNDIGVPLKNVLSFNRVMGGAPANVAMAVAKLKGNSAFISKVGEDAFGSYIIDKLEEFEVDTSWVYKTKEANTGLAFVSLKDDGERDFSFYRNPSADMLLREKEVEGINLSKGDIIHFCSVDLIDAPVKKAHRKIIENALKNEALISFDPNVRLPLWESSENCRDAIREFIPYAHILKISDEEIHFITEIEDSEKAIKSLFIGNVQWVIYTLGSKGAVIITKDNKKLKFPGYSVQACDTTGAGDAFVGALLYKLLSKSIDIYSLKNIEKNDLKEIMMFCNSYAALTTTKHGAVDAMPTMEETINFMENFNKE